MEKLSVVLLALALVACSAPPASGRLFIAVIEQYPAAGENQQERDVYVVHYLLDGVPYEASVRGQSSKTALIEHLNNVARREPAGTRR